MVEPQTGFFKVRNRLPTQYYTEIGRIIFRFAMLEAKLFHITNLVLGVVDRKQARLAVRKSRAAEQLNLIRDLAKLNGIHLTVNWTVLREALKEGESYRDRLAHCMWISHPDTKIPVLQDFSTAYLPGLPKGTNARITPLAVKVPLTHLRNIRTNMDKINSHLDQLEKRVLQQIDRASRRKPRRQ